MKYNSIVHNRHSMRLKGYDYSKNYGSVIFMKP